MLKRIVRFKNRENGNAPSVDELLGMENGNAEAYQDIKPTLAKKLRRMSQLPSNDLKALSTFIDALIFKQQIKGTGVHNEA